MFSSGVRQYLAAILFLSKCIGLPASAATFVISDNASGGDCDSPGFPGQWDDATKTCALQDDLAGSISITAGNITLDGNGKILSPAAGDDAGVFSRGHNDVAVHNLKVNGFNYGIVFIDARDVEVKNSEITGIRAAQDACGICLFKVLNSAIEDNHLHDNQGYGIALWSSHVNRISKNTVETSLSSNIIMRDSRSNSLMFNAIAGDGTNADVGVEDVRGVGNVIGGNRFDNNRSHSITLVHTDNDRIFFNLILNSFEGIKVDRSNTNLIFCNDINTGRIGVDLVRPSINNVVWWNNFLELTSARDRNPNLVNWFDRPLPVGGNYWQVNAPACADTRAPQGFCDRPYLFRGNQDNLPRVDKVPWKQDPNICFDPAGEAEEFALYRRTQ